MYKDRGIIKWLPFDALSSFRESIEELTLNRNKITKPILSDDQIATLNYNLNEAYHLDKPIIITYFEGGFLKSSSGLVSKIDRYNQTLNIYNLIVQLESIIEIMID